MDHFQYHGRVLHAEAVPLPDLAEAVGTPFYVYSSATLRRHYQVFTAALAGLDALTCFAVKANGSLAVIATLARLGAGADVVSGGELESALAAGVPAERIVFSGVGKSARELKAALTADILQINVESVPEMEALSRIACSVGTTARVALRINPDIDAHTHAKITTGVREAKFGIEWTAAHQVYARAAALPGLQPVGIAVHIGSQLTEIEPFAAAFQRLRDLIVMLRRDGHTITTLDLGGGLGVPYGDEEGPIPGPDAYAAVVRRAVGDLGCRLILEPGRLLVANAGLLVTRVLYIKEGATRTFVIVDAGMNDLMRPAMYGAHHAVVPVVNPEVNDKPMVADVVGPICETSDTFASGCTLPPLRAGDLLAIRTAGAYGSSMASFYNARPLCPEVLVADSTHAVVRERIPWQALLSWQRLPAWLAPPADESQGQADGR
ncbi:Diaminopimelate decarboxylase [Candidatus Defluviicoccus seviourii]|uniref:Diaminopimelate decarboxylase n=1 Tax=Candidatus Defluviicoccus seviourii TaxID=2565273 RepID=A0A564WFD6_9PROT|nr:Diaminopimelate decarboxylase [Candidatus Defluviicoccus seviourii]